MTQISSIQDFDYKVMKELNANYISETKELYEGVFRCDIKLEKVLVPNDDGSRFLEKTLTWFGIGKNQEDAEITAIKKACKYFGWSENLIS